MRLRGPCIGGILSPLPIVQGMGGHGQIVNTVQIVRGYQTPCSLAPMHMRLSTLDRLSKGRLPRAIYHGSSPCDNRRCPENRGGSSTITGNRSRTTRPFADKHGNSFFGPLIMPIVKSVSRFLIFSSSYLRARGGATRRHSRKASQLGPHNIDAGVSKYT